MVALLSKPAYDIRFGHSNLDGVFASVVAKNVGDPPCLNMPKSSSDEMLVRVVTKWLEDHPKELDQNQHLLVVKALRDTFGCR